MQMRMTEERFIPSSDGVSRLHVMHWRPEGEAVAVLQLVHGMTEHIRRYDEFARFLAAQGIAVVGHDQLGHGETAGAVERLGYFAKEKGEVYLIQDIRRVHHLTEKWYPGVPNLLMGHSMGSFMVRRYLTRYGAETDGVILMGTGNQSEFLLLLGMAVVRLTGLLHGGWYRSPLLHKLVLGNYNRKIRKAETDSDWLSRDRERVRQFEDDPYCHFRFTCSAYEDFFQVMLDLKHRKWLRKMPKDLPIFLVSGKEDPVGSYGRGVGSLYRLYRRLGMEDVELKLYDGCRHELVNEIGREQVFEDLSSWCLKHSLRRQR